MSITVEVFEQTAGVPFTIHVEQGDSVLDLTTVDDATIKFQREDGSEFEWTGIVPSNATATTLDLVRTIAAADFPEPELIRGFGFLNVGGVNKRLFPFHVHVLPFAAP